MEILTQLLSAHRVPQIAQALHISPHTVRNHLKSIFGKVGVSSQASLIRKVRSLSE
jgi:DNA-binding CsgD family transcriptional regulator